MRIAEAGDFRHFYGADAPEFWVGFTAVRDGVPVAIGLIAWDEDGTALGHYDCRGAVSAIKVHRGALRLIDAVRQAGETRILAHCNDTIPGSWGWMQRLGFEAIPEHAGWAWLHLDDREGR